jgi:hypothetical protein
MGVMSVAADDILSKTVGLLAGIISFFLAFGDDLT